MRKSPTKKSGREMAEKKGPCKRSKDGYHLYRSAKDPITGRYFWFCTYCKERMK